MHATKIICAFIRLFLSKVRLKLCTILFACSWRVWKALFSFCSPTICTSRAFVYNAVDVYVQVTTWQYLGWFANPWWLFKANSQHRTLLQTEIYGPKCILALSLKRYSTHRAETLVTHFLGTVNNAEKIFKSFERCAKQIGFRWDGHKWMFHYIIYTVCIHVQRYKMFHMKLRRSAYSSTTSCGLLVLSQEDWLTLTQSILIAHRCPRVSLLGRCDSVSSNWWLCYGLWVCVVCIPTGIL